MEVILIQDVDKIGKNGQVIHAKDGYARNYLFPHKLAVPKTPENMKRLELQRKKIEEEQEKIKKAAEALKAKLESLSLTMPVLTQEDEKLYGSITSHEVAQALKEEGHIIDKNLIQMDEPIKKLGIYEIPVKLHPEVVVKIKLWIVKK